MYFTADSFIRFALSRFKSEPAVKRSIVFDESRTETNVTKKLFLILFGSQAIVYGNVDFSMRANNIATVKSATVKVLEIIEQHLQNSFMLPFRISHLVSSTPIFCSIST